MFDEVQNVRFGRVFAHETGVKRQLAHAVVRREQAQLFVRQIALVIA